MKSAWAAVSPPAAYLLIVDCNYWQSLTYFWLRIDGASFSLPAFPGVKLFLLFKEPKCSDAPEMLALKADNSSDN